MLAVGFCENYIRLVNPINSRIGYKLSELIRMQIGENIIYIPTRVPLIDPLKKAHEFINEHSDLDLTYQMKDLNSANVRLLGLVYNVEENKVKLIFSGVREAALLSSELASLTNLRYLEMELTEYEYFSYTYVNINTWNFCQVRSILNVSNKEFTEMFQLSCNVFNGTLHLFIDLNELKMAGVKKDVNASICSGKLVEEQTFFDLDVESNLTPYAVVRTHEDTSVPDSIMKEFTNGYNVLEPVGDVRVINLELEV